MIPALRSPLEGEAAAGPIPPDELVRENAGVAGAPAGAAPGTGVGPGVGEHGLRARTGEPGTPGGTPPDRKTRFVETSRGILSYGQLAPLLGERVLACAEATVTFFVASSPAAQKEKPRERSVTT